MSNNEEVKKIYTPESLDERRRRVEKEYRRKDRAQAKRFDEMGPLSTDFFLPASEGWYVLLSHSDKDGEWFSAEMVVGWYTTIEEDTPGEKDCKWGYPVTVLGGDGTVTAYGYFPGEGNIVAVFHESWVDSLDLDVLAYRTHFRSEVTNAAEYMRSRRKSEEQR
jgi:hypothetical protein